MSFKVRKGLRAVVIRDHYIKDNVTGQPKAVYAEDSLNYWLSNNPGAVVKSIQFMTNCDAQGNSISSYSILYYPSLKMQKLLGNKVSKVKQKQKQKLRKLAISV